MICSSRDAFFQVMTNLDLLKYITSFQKGKKWDDIYFASWVCQHEHFILLKEKKDLIFDQDTFKIAISKGRMDVVKWLYRKLPNHITNQGVKYAFRYNQFDIARWLHSKNRNDNPKILVEYAMKSGSLDMIKWLYTITEISEISHYKIAIQNGHLHILKWLKKHRRRYHGDFGESACSSGKLELVQWLLENSITELNEKCLRTVVYEKGSLELFQFVCSKVQHTFTIFTDAIYMNRMDIVEFLSPFYLYCAIDITYAVQKANVEVLDYLKKKGHLLTFSGRLLYYGDKDEVEYLKTIQWLHENYFEFDLVSCIRTACFLGHLSIIKWLCDTFNRESVLSHIKDTSSIDILKYLEEIKENVGKKFHPAIGQGKLSDFQWAYERGYLDDNDLDLSLKCLCYSKQADVFQWVYSIRKSVSLEEVMKIAYRHSIPTMIKWIHSFSQTVSLRDIETAIEYDCVYALVYLLKRYQNLDTAPSMYEKLIRYAELHTSEACLQWLEEQFI